MINIEQRGYYLGEHNSRFCPHLEEERMGQTKLAGTEYQQIAGYPECRKCGVPIWFVRSAKGFDGQYQHFECVLCETATEVLHND
jgi:hypothetical protein